MACSDSNSADEATDAATDAAAEASDDATSNDDDIFAEFNVPDDVELTKPGTTLKFGEPAVVAVKDHEGIEFYWEITAQEFKRIPQEEFAAQGIDFGDNEPPKEIVCAIADVKWAGGDVPDGDESMLMEPPTLTPLGAGDNEANELRAYFGDICGTDESDVEVRFDEFDPTRTYTADVMSYVDSAGEGIDPTAVAFKYSDAVLTGGKAGDNAIIWK